VSVAVADEDWLTVVVPDTESDDVAVTTEVTVSLPEEDRVGLPVVEADTLFDADRVNTPAGSTLIDTEIVPDDERENVTAPEFESETVTVGETIDDGVRDAEPQEDALAVSLGDVCILLETVCVPERDWVTVGEPDEECDADTQVVTDGVGFPSVGDKRLLGEIELERLVVPHDEIVVEDVTDLITESVSTGDVEVESVGTDDGDEEAVLVTDNDDDVEVVCVNDVAADVDTIAEIETPAVIVDVLLFVIDTSDVVVTVAVIELLKVRVPVEDAVGEIDCSIDADDVGQLDAVSVWELDELGVVVWVADAEVHAESDGVADTELVVVALNVKSPLPVVTTVAVTEPVGEGLKVPLDDIIGVAVAVNDPVPELVDNVEAVGKVVALPHAVEVEDVDWRDEVVGVVDEVAEDDGVIVVFADMVAFAVMDAETVDVAVFVTDVENVDVAVEDREPVEELVLVTATVPEPE
jgi:hypothetical protein